MFWTEEKLWGRRDELRRHVARESVTVGPFRYHEGDLAGAFGPTLDDSTWPVVAPLQRIGGQPDMITWFRAVLTVPEGLGRKPLALRFGEHIARGGHNDMPEALLYLDGRPYHGLDRNHREIFLPAELCEAGRTVSLAIQAWSGWRQYDSLYWQDPELIHFDAETDALAYDFDAVLQTVRTMEKTSHLRVELLNLVEAAMQAIDWTAPGSDRFYASVRDARAVMAEGFERLQRSEPLKPIVNHIGHTHLDVAWLWTLGNIKLKTARSWSSALRMMEQYPDFSWIQSQPQLYKYIKQTQPEIWEQVKQRVAEGRWEADGGMWVEADCNLSGGESLIRQFLHGTRFFREEFGVENVVLWLPDVFGYAWALPQIIKGCGLKYFMTTKISWNQFNRFPYDTFRWRGIDGTEVLTHFITAPVPNRHKDSWNYTYNAEIIPDVVKGAWDLYQQKEINQEPLSSFGFGDGGGGPTRRDMEFAHRLADMPGIPHVKIGRVGEYFDRLHDRVWADPRLPVWNGELYLEYHRGTYTSQAQQKRNNRKLEFLLHNAELYAALAGIVTGAEYPRPALDEAWEIVLRNQFHDIIPGSSIRPVYEESAVEYQAARELAGGALSEAEASLTSVMDLAEESLVVFNPTGLNRGDLVEVELPEGTVPVDEEGLPLPTQGKLVYAVDVPANGYRAYPLRPFAGAEASGRLTVTPQLVETPHFRIELNAAGQIARLYDRVQNREVLAPGRAANVLQAFEDKPMHYDAWDIDIYY
ncbi:MAG TPA: glycoside hydrolase family 38 C-terminal domain-containing protein, partial [Symbiobacteriaceae bacterium]|nr:glycoside hydrolase family 38 C-terminal domain-containing protein [Symbiobacteriaceae bacterium]